MRKVETTRSLKLIMSFLFLISMVFTFSPTVHAAESDDAADSNIAEVVTAPSANLLTYNGEYQPLVTEGAASNGIMVYSLTENEEYTTEIPTAQNAGDYVVYYYVQGNDGYTSSDVQSITVTIQKADATVITAPVANTLTYNGEYQQLVTPGEASGGIMMYNHLNSFDRGFSEAVPSGNMGYYDVWYYVKGDDNHNNSEKAKVGVTIEKAIIEGPIEVEIAEPVVGAEQQKSIYFDKYYAQIIWTPSVTVFEADTDYHASVTIQPKTSRAYCFDAAEAEKYIESMRADGWTVYGNANSISMNKTFSTKVKPKVTVSAQNQSIIYGRKIIENAYYFSCENTAISVSATLTPSTENVTVNGTIALSNIVITENVNDVTADYELILNHGKLVINPDVSKIENLTTENVTSANTEDIENVRNMMASAETEGIDEETKNAWDEITATCQTLLEQIENVQAKITRAQESIVLYDSASVKSTDRDSLIQLSEDTTGLLDTENLTSDERTEMESIQTDIAALLAALDAAEAALNTENISVTRDITADNVQQEDRAVLEAAVEDLNNVLDIYVGNYTEDEQKSIADDILRIESAISVLDQADDVTQKINDLPETVDPNDQEAFDQLLDVENAYNALTDHGKTLVDENAKEKLERLLDSLSADSPDDSVYYPVYRLYNPYTHEHLLSSDEKERDSLLGVGWTLDGIAWNAPETGAPVYRLYNPYDDWHTYTMNQEEIDILTSLGWVVDGVVTRSASAENGMPIYRLFNPYEPKNYHLLTASEDERMMLESLGWKLDGVAWYCLSN